MLTRHTRLRLKREDAGTGAGSRGGHVIGKTSSGKPIYDSHGHEGHKGFSAQDHHEAAGHHLRQRSVILADKTRGKGMKAQREAAYKHHDAQYVAHMRSSLKSES